MIGNHQLLVIVIGANGAGKSTWCRNNQHLLPDRFYDADSIAQGLGGYNDLHNQREARKLVDGFIEEHMSARESFGFESTFSGESRVGIVKNARELGYEVDAVFIGTLNLRINIKRVASRVRSQTGHHVPSNEIIRRWNACQTNLINAADDLRETTVLDNTGIEPQEVARFAARRVTYIDPHADTWVKKLMFGIDDSLRIDKHPDPRGFSR